MFDAEIFEELRGLIDVPILWGIVGGLAWSAIFEVITPAGGNNQ